MSRFTSGTCISQPGAMQALDVPQIHPVWGGMPSPLASLPGQNGAHQLRSRKPALKPGDVVPSIEFSANDRNVPM